MKFFNTGATQNRPSNTEGLTSQLKDLLINLVLEVDHKNIDKTEQRRESELLKSIKKAIKNNPSILKTEVENGETPEDFLKSESEGTMSARKMDIIEKILSWGKTKKKMSNIFLGKNDHRPSSKTTEESFNAKIEEDNKRYDFMLKNEEGLTNVIKKKHRNIRLKTRDDEFFSEPIRRTTKIEHHKDFFLNIGKNILERREASVKKSKIDSITPDFDTTTILPNEEIYETLKNIQPFLQPKKTIRKMAFVQETFLKESSVDDSSTEEGDKVVYETLRNVTSLPTENLPNWDEEGRKDFYATKSPTLPAEELEYGTKKGGEPTYSELVKTLKQPWSREELAVSNKPKRTDELENGNHYEEIWKSNENFAEPVPPEQVMSLNEKEGSFLTTVNGSIESNLRKSKKARGKNNQAAETSIKSWGEVYDVVRDSKINRQKKVHFPDTTRSAVDMQKSKKGLRHFAQISRDTSLFYKDLSSSLKLLDVTSFQHAINKYSKYINDIRPNEQKAPAQTEVFNNIFPEVAGTVFADIIIRAIRSLLIDKNVLSGSNKATGMAELYVMIEKILENSEEIGRPKYEKPTEGSLIGMVAMHCEENQAIKIISKIPDKILKEEIDTCNEDGNTPLYTAIAKGKQELSAYLLERGANPNIANEDQIKYSQAQHSPAHCAIKKGYMGLFESMMEIQDKNKRLDISQRFTDITMVPEGGVARMVISSHSFADLILRNSRFEEIEKVVKNYGTQGKELFEEAFVHLILKGDEEVASEIIKHKYINLNCEVKLGEKQNQEVLTPITAAIKRQNIGIIKKLIQQGVDLEYKDLNGKTPIEMAKKLTGSNGTRIIEIIERAITKNGKEISTNSYVNALEMYKEDSESIQTQSIKNYTHQENDPYESPLLRPHNDKLARRRTSSKEDRDATFRSINFMEEGGPEVTQSIHTTKPKEGIVAEDYHINMSTQKGKSNSLPNTRRGGHIGSDIRNKFFSNIFIKPHNSWKAKEGNQDSESEDPKKSRKQTYL